MGKESGTDDWTLLRLRERIDASIRGAHSLGGPLSPTPPALPELVAALAEEREAPLLYFGAAARKA